MKNTFYNLWIILVGVLSPVLNAQIIDSFPVDSLSSRLEKQTSLFPHEKLYVQIDKPLYIAGEDIWFRAHLTDAYSGKPSTTSRYIYAELISPADSVMKRVKIKPEHDAYCGHIPLGEDIPAGDYQLRFYTRFMENQGDDYFFRRTIKIGDLLSALYRTEALFEYEKNNKKVHIELSFMDTETDTPIRPDRIRITGNDETRIFKADDDGSVRLSLKTPTDKKSKVLYLEYDYSGKFHKEYIFIPYPDDFEVSFLPEGGNIPKGKQTQIAFKALNAEGLGEDIKGFLINEKGDTISSFQSKHLGMGSFLFNADKEEKYRVVCKNGKGIEKRYELPAATNSVALQARWHRDNLYVSVNKAADYVVEKPLYVVLQCRGRFLGVSVWNDNQEYLLLKKEDLLTGVNQLLLVDAAMNPLSERLVFNLNEKDLAGIAFETDKNNYKQREQVNIFVKFSDTENRLLPADVSISVTDNNDVTPDTHTNILSTLLVTSELKGYIESPACYFKDRELTTLTNLDLLMMTQGWSRYNIPEVLQGKFDKPDKQPELEQVISGTVKGGLLMDRGTANYPVTLIAAAESIYGTTTTDKNGCFYFNGFETRDSTRFVLQGNTKQGGDRVELKINPEEFPIGRYTTPFSKKMDLETEENLFVEYQKKADKQFTVVNGMRMIYLGEVSVTAKSLVKRGKSSFSSPHFNKIITLEQIEEVHVINTYDLLKRFNAENAGTILLDEVQIRLEDLLRIPVSDIEEIEIMKGPEAGVFFGLGDSGKALFVTTKKGEFHEFNEMNYNIKSITPLGFQVSKEFYSPQYQTKAQKENSLPDLRTTIYWNPSVKTPEDGGVNVMFYTSDASTTYSVVIEGITDEGHLIHTIGKIYRDK